MGKRGRKKVVRESIEMDLGFIFSSVSPFSPFLLSYIFFLFVPIRVYLWLNNYFNQQKPSQTQVPQYC